MTLPTTRTAPTAVRTGPPGWLVVLLAVACGLTVANLYYAQPLLAELRGAFDIGAVAASWLVTATQLGYAAGMVLLVPLGDRVENRRLVLVLLLVATAGQVAAGTAVAFPVLVAASLVAGTTSVVAQILVPMAAGLAAGGNAGRVVGQVMSGLLTGILLSRVLSSVVSDLTNWRVVYLVSAALLAVLAVVLRAALPAREPTTRIRYGALLSSTARLVRTHAPLRRRAAYQAAMFGAFSAFWSTISYLLTGPGFGYSQLAVGLFALVGAAGAVAAPFAGRLADRGLGRRLTLAGFLLAAAAFGVAGIGQHRIVALGAAAVVLDAAVQCVQIVGQRTVYGLDHTARARLNSVYVATLFVGGAIGSQLGTVAYHLGGWYALAAFGGVLPLLALAGWATERRPAAATG